MEQTVCLVEDGLFFRKASRTRLRFRPTRRGKTPCRLEHRRQGRGARAEAAPFRGGFQNRQKQESGKRMEGERIAAAKKAGRSARPFGGTPIVPPGLGLRPAGSRPFRRDLAASFLRAAFSGEEYKQGESASLARAAIPQRRESRGNVPSGAIAPRGSDVASAYRFCFTRHQVRRFERATEDTAILKLSDFRRRPTTDAESGRATPDRFSSRATGRLPPMTRRRTRPPKGSG